MAQELIEELIEESYLLSLSEPEIRFYLTNFIEACDTVVNERLNGSNDLRIIGIKVALLRARFFVHGQSVPQVHKNCTAGQADVDVETLAGHVLKTKRCIRRLFDSIDPKLIDEVELATKKRIYPAVSSEKNGHRRPPSLIYRIGYTCLYLLVACILMIYLAY